MVCGGAGIVSLLLRNEQVIGPSLSVAVATHRKALGDF